MLFMSGYAQEQIVGEGLLEAHHPLLRKPFSPAALAAAVASILDLKASQA
jgi:CheY-like chemotaxis protein